LDSGTYSWISQRKTGKIYCRVRSVTTRNNWSGQQDCYHQNRKRFSEREHGERTDYFDRQTNTEQLRVDKNKYPTANVTCWTGFNSVVPNDQYLDIRDIMRYNNNRSLFRNNPVIRVFLIEKVSIFPILNSV